MTSLVLTWIKSNKKLVAGILAFLLVAGYILYNSLTIASLRDSLDAANSNLATATQKVEALESSYTDLVSKTDKMQVDLNRYFFLATQAETNYQNSLSLLGKLRDRETQATTDPISLTKDIRAEVEDFENQYSCLTGNLESCSQQQ